MIGKILKKDLIRNQVITLILFVFILLAAFLVASAIGIVMELSGAMDSLFEKTKAPDFVQMHTGELDQGAIDEFVRQHPDMVKGQQTVALLNINGANIVMGQNQLTEADSVMENAFVTQNTDFDFLVGTDHQVLEMSKGEVAVPLYHKLQYDLQLGDPIRIESGAFQMELTIAGFLRDAQMNPSVVTSKRFLVSPEDWKILQEQFGETEYLIEFELHDTSQASGFESLYHSSGLPQKGPALTRPLFRLLNSLADGIVAAVIILVGILLVAIALLCLRFTMIAAIEEDIREIGVMKAIGISSKDIRRLYQTKYVVMAAAASLCGYLLSLWIGSAFTKNITLYMGSAEQNTGSRLLPLAGAGLVFIAVVLFCRLVLGRFRNISAVEALRTGASQKSSKKNRGLKLSRGKLSNANVFLGLNEVVSHFKAYGLLCFVFIISSFLMVVPLNTLSTIQSPDFITYMGAGQSDIRIDLQQAGNMEQRYQDMIDYIEGDSDISAYAALLTSTFQAVDRDGLYENIKVEIGDFTTFPLEYSQGEAPRQEDEIALSSMNATDFGKNVGDPFTLVVEGEERDLTVCGIYQDVTNGGQTAKALLPYDPDNILWYIVNLNVKEGTDLSAKIEEYGNAFYPAKVADMEDYMSQTLGNITRQLRLAVQFACGLSIGISVLITAMFFKMLTAKDASQISIMRGLGFSLKDIRLQYITRILLVLLTGIVMGTVMAGVLGGGLASVIIPGVSSIRFQISPLVSYFLCPLALVAAVTVTVLASSIAIKRISSLNMAAE